IQIFDTCHINDNAALILLAVQIKLAFHDLNDAIVLVGDQYLVHTNPYYRTLRGIALLSGITSRGRPDPANRYNGCDKDTNIQALTFLAKIERDSSTK